MVIVVKDQTGWHNLIHRKDVNPALAQLALIFQKTRILNLDLILTDHLLHFVEQNILSYGPPNYSKKYRNAQNLNNF